MNKEFIKTVKAKATTIGDFLMALNLVVNGYIFWRDYIKPKLKKEEKKNESGNQQLNNEQQ